MLSYKDKLRLMRFGLTAVAVASVATTCAIASPTPHPINTFGDWSVGCDNGLTCLAFGLTSGARANVAATTSIERAPEPDALPKIRINIDDLIVKGLMPTGLVIDGHQRFTTPMAFSDQDGEIEITAPVAFVGKISEGRTLELVDAAGKLLAIITLSGMKAVLSYMDRQQRRTGTVTALINRGLKPASTIPKPPPLPLLVVGPGSPTSASHYTPKSKASCFKNLRCNGQPLRSGARVKFPLDVQRRLVICSWHCGKGEPNLLSTALIVDADGIVAPARFDVSVRANENGVPALPNADWDPERRLLVINEAGASLAACNMTRSFAWDGDRFRLIEQAEGRECRGNFGHIVNWLAKVDPVTPSDRPTSR